MKLVHPDLPLASLLTGRDSPVQQSFAQRAVRKLGPSPTGVAYEVAVDGLRVYARDESAYAAVVARVRDRLGDSATLQWPLVRYRIGEHLEEPIMDLRVEVPDDAVHIVREELQRRQAKSIEVAVMPEMFVLRARGTLRRLMGLLASLNAATAGRAKLTMWLSHYERMVADRDCSTA